MSIILEQVLAKVREADLKVFKEKILPMEEAKEAELRAQGLRNINQLMEDQKSGYSLDYSSMGTETNVDGEVLIVPSAPTDQTIDTRSGGEMFKDFLEKLK